MLSVNFSTPLNGPARSERIKQMSNNHPAFEKSRITQEILVKIQHSLRRMPGVAANESNEIIQRLIEVGQVISQETSALVEAVMNLHLDQEDTDKAIARMSIEANLAKAHTDDQAQRINSLEEEVRLEKKKREDAEGNLKNIMGGIVDITTEFKQLRDKADKQKTDSLNKGLPFFDGDFLIRSLDNTIQLLEDEVTKQHELWAVQQQPRSEGIPRPIEPPPENVQFPGPPFGRAASRQGFQNNPQFRPSFPQSAFAMPENPPQRPSSAFGYGRDYFPSTPTGQSRGRYNGRLRDNAPPPPLLDFGASSSSGSTSVPPGALVSRNPYSNQPITITEQAVQAWHGHMMHFYATIRNFVERHANNPDPTGETKLSQTHLWPILLATYYPLSEQAAESYLDHHIRSENSKSCIVTRVIIDFVVNRVWNPSAWAGADADSTYAIMEVERDLEHTTGQPSAIRQPILDRMAAIIDVVMKKEQGGPFIKNRVEEATHALLTSLQPLMNTFYNAVDAIQDLEQVIDSAYEISFKILTSRLTFDFRFPEIGSRFSSQSMLPIWPPTDPLELQAKHWRVALVTTPVVTCRNDTGSNISAHSVSLADVFCMQ
ncbi:hypothetical protein TASIC1_0003043500 [Trichoderma asperellum]|uniref:Uncharacterized protein n=1 Tax=Trichoderma asperellum TaxID=101201 RepID=A0A6V8QNG3_TRIAP|nr:hypothetical protein TASIC1_0003043500 [Trichoderma asperellum]